jgi:hypothetical protein
MYDSTRESIREHIAKRKDKYQGHQERVKE